MEVFSHCHGNVVGSKRLRLLLGISYKIVDLEQTRFRGNDYERMNQNARYITKLVYNKVENEDGRIWNIMTQNKYVKQLRTSRVLYQSRLRRLPHRFFVQKKIQNFLNVNMIEQMTCKIYTNVILFIQCYQIQLSNVSQVTPK